MTKLKKNINLFFLIILLCSSAANIALFRSGYSFIPKSYVLFAICYAAFFGAMAFLSLSNKENAGKASRISAALMPTGALIGTGSLLFLLGERFAYRGLYYILFILIAAAASLSVFYRHCKTVWLVVVRTVLAAVMAKLLLFFTVAAIVTGGDFAVETVEADIDSPGGTYNAVVIRRDEGALGGSNTVMIRNVKRDKKLLSGTLESSYVTVRHGGFGDEYNISWADDETLVVNGAEEKV